MKQVIAITGKIGVGKSTILKILNKNFVVFSVDQIQNNLYQKNNLLYKLLQNKYPHFLENQLVQKKKIKKFLIQNTKLKTQFENDVVEILVPYIKKLINKNKGFIFIEIPYINSQKLSSIFDKIIIVEAEQDKRIKRITKRDNITKKEALAWSDAYVKNITFTKTIALNNNNSLQELKIKLKEVLKCINS